MQQEEAERDSELSTTKHTLEQAEKLALTTWRRGFTAALVSLAQWGEDTIYDDVVVSSGEPEALIKQARKDGAMRWSGLDKFVRRRKEAGDGLQA